MSQKQPHQHRRRHQTSKYDESDSNEKRKPQLSQTKRRKQAAISLASFSSKKGHDRAIQEYKKRKEEKFQKNAVLLREYQRAMKQEGYDVGRGASRKRDNRVKKDGDFDDEAGRKIKGDERSRMGADAEEDAEQQSRKKRHKSDPLHHARKEAERRKAEQLDLASQKEERQKTESQKQQSRKVRARKLMKRTKRGQPLMKNVIGDMLDKIKNEVGER